MNPSFLFVKGKESACSKSRAISTKQNQLREKKKEESHLPPTFLFQLLFNCFFDPVV